LKLFTELPLEKIRELEKLTGAGINEAKIVLADEATSMLHGRECLDNIHQTISNMFSGAGASTESLPRIFVSSTDLDGGGKTYAELFVQLELATSKKEAKRLIQGGGARLEGEKIENENGSLSMTDFEGKTEVTFRAGKKRAGVVELQ
jgi:tyrosyl-tRNA synthetase